MGEFIGDKSVSRSSKKGYEEKNEKKRSVSQEPVKGSAKKEVSNETSSKKKTSSGSSTAKNSTVKSSKSASKSSSKSTTKSSTTKSSAAKNSSSGASGAKKTSQKTAVNESKKRSAKPGNGSYYRQTESYDKYEQDLHNSEYAKQLTRERRIRAFERNRKLRDFLLHFSIAAAVIAVTVILSTTVLFNIETINVEIIGAVPYTQEEIMEKSGLEPGQNMFTPAVFAVADELEAKMPYIENCSLKRKLPSGVTIVVEAAEVLGLLETEDGRSYVVSTSGRALEFVTIETDTAHLTRVTGINLVGEFAEGEAVAVDDAGRLETVSKLVSLFANHEMHLDTISFNATGELFATYDKRIQFVFGLPTGLEAKVLLAANLITTGKITEIEGGRLDLSIDGEATFTPDYLLSEPI